MNEYFPAVADGTALKALLAGGDDYIRTKNNKVRGLALNPIKNPEAPEIVIVGHGRRIITRAHLFVECNTPVPVYVKAETNVWHFAGMYRSIEFSQSVSDIQIHGAGRPAGSVHGVLFLERCDSADLEIVGGGFANAKIRKETEQAAISFVTEILTNEGYAVEDGQSQNLGYDLIGTKELERVLIEVKGTNFPVPRFFISRNEERCGRREADWMLFVVTAARDDAPTLHRFTFAEMRRQFRFETLAWQCTPIAEIGRVTEATSGTHGLPEAKV